MHGLATGSHRFFWLMLGAGCGPAAFEQTLLPVPLPTFEGLADAAQQQLWYNTLGPGG